MSKRVQEKFIIKNQVTLRNLVFIALITILFTLAYAQSPLYTSNQNQYFLHGLAKAGVGSLSNDWLATTLDPTPVFSGMIYLVYSLIPWPPIFYVIFGLLGGVFIWSLYGITVAIFKRRETPAQQLFFITVLIGVFSAALNYMIVRIINIDWAYLFDGGVAGQRILGPVLQPSAFGVFLLLSIYLFLAQKYKWSLVFLVLAPTIHPTYLLSAGVLTLVYMGILLAEKRDIRAPLAFGGAALVGVLPILIHAYLTFGGTSPEITTRARNLLVEFRIPHHAIPAEWFDGSVIIKIGFILLGLTILWFSKPTVSSSGQIAPNRKLFFIVAIPFLIASTGTLAQITLNNDMLALLFPWRISTWLVPISVSIIVIWIAAWIWGWLSTKLSSKWILGLSLVAVLIFAGIGTSKSLLNYEEQQTSSERATLDYVVNNHSSQDVYLIPLQMQDFRLVTGVPAYVEFKSIPYKDVDVIEWFNRVSLANKVYQAPYTRIGCKNIETLYLQGVTHVIAPYDHTISGCENLVLLFQDFEKFEVYRIIELD